MLLSEKSNGHKWWPHQKKCHVYDHSQLSVRDYTSELTSVLINFQVYMCSLTVSYRGGTIKSPFTVTLSCIQHGVWTYWNIHGSRRHWLGRRTTATSETATRHGKELDRARRIPVDFSDEWRHFKGEESLVWLNWITTMITLCDEDDVLMCKSRIVWVRFLWTPCRPQYFIHFQQYSTFDFSYSWQIKVLWYKRFRQAFQPHS